MTKGRTRYDEVWQRQVQWLRKFIKDLKETPTAHGQKWKDAMLLHYEGKLKELLKQRRKPR